MNSSSISTSLKMLGIRQTLIKNPTSEFKFAIEAWNDSHNGLPLASVVSYKKYWKCDQNNEVSPNKKKIFFELNVNTWFGWVE